MTESRLVGLRGLLGLSRGLIAYGVVALLVASAGLAAIAWVNGRIGDIHTEAETTVARLAVTTELAATLLRGAATTAESFSGTADQSAAAVSSAIATVAEVRLGLATLEGQLRSFSFFGAIPFESSADSLGRINASMDGLDTDIQLVADNLGENRDALTANATALTRLAASASTLASRLGPDLGPDEIEGVQQVVALTLLMFAAWSLLPGTGALLVGLWLRRELGRSD